MLRRSAVAARGTACLVLLLLAGCHSEVQSLEYGEPNFNTALLLAYLKSPPGRAVNGPIAAVDAQGNSLSLLPSARPTAAVGPQIIPDECLDASAANRNVTACVYTLKGLIDDQYREYRITLHHLADGGNALADTIVLGVNTAGATVVGAAAKTILAAIGVGVGGTKSIFNQDILYKQAIISVLNQMDADRDKQFKVMLDEMNGSSPYTLAQAKDDLLLYFEYGTFDHGISSLQAATAANKEKCQKQLDAAKIAVSSGNGAPVDGSTATGGCSDTTNGS